MNDYKQYERMAPVSPGEILLEDFLKPMQISQNKLASDTAMPPNRISLIIAGKRAITTDTAMRLAAFFGTSAEFWINLQTAYELDIADRNGERARIVEMVRPAIVHEQQLQE